jgi:co-chaperonin GroES (HSP10)
MLVPVGSYLEVDLLDDRLGEDEESAVYSTRRKLSQAIIVTIPEPPKDEKGNAIPRLFQVGDRIAFHPEYCLNTVSVNGKTHYLISVFNVVGVIKDDFCDPLIAQISR